MRPSQPLATLARRLLILMLFAGLSLVSACNENAQDSPGKAESAPAQAPAAEPPAPDPLRNPALAQEKAPDHFRVQLDTTRGKIILAVERAWSPMGADRFYNLVTIGFFDEIAVFRVIENFMAQFGIHGDPGVSRVWQRATIKDDPVVESNTRGTLSFAKTGRPHSRTTQIFINFKDNTNLDGMGFSPFARVVEGMDVVDEIYKVGEGRPRGPGPNQNRIQTMGNAFLEKNFPKLDYIKGARIVD